MMVTIRPKPIALVKIKGEGYLLYDAERGFKRFDH